MKRLVAIQKIKERIKRMSTKTKAVKSAPCHYGWSPDLPDHRDLQYAAPLMTLAALPSKVDLRSKCPKVYNQEQIGSCTANAIAAAIEFDLLKQKKPDFTPSRLFIYYNERAMEKTVATDSGAQIRDGIKSVNQLGVCPETLWPYIATPADPNTNVFPPGAKPAEKPPTTCYQSALKYKALSYLSVSRDLAQFRGCLAAGYPFVLGFTVYAAFESSQVAQTGTLNLPASSEQVMGGHAVMAVGYDDTAQRFIIRNSWGNGWGMKGYFTMPYAYLLSQKLSSDFWTIRVVE
jgi:C1A family cysteine protease